MKKLISFKELKVVKTKRTGESDYNIFTPDIKIVCKDFTVQSYEKSIHEKVIQKVNKIEKDGVKYFDLDEYKKIMRFDFNFELDCFKSK